MKFKAQMVSQEQEEELQVEDQACKCLKLLGNSWEAMFLSEN